MTYNASKDKENNCVGIKLREARKERGMKLPDVSKKLRDFGLDVNYKTISKWEIGDSIPNTYQFLAVCKALEIRDVLSAFTDSGIPDLNETGLKKLADYREDLVASGRYAVRTNSIIYIDMPVSNLSVSAGLGEFLDDGNYDMISVPAYTVPKGAKFGVHVAGDSMEPVFHDGQIVWVEDCKTLRRGEVGIMIYDGCGYLKMYDEKEPDNTEAFTDSEGTVRMQPVMVSYNKKYEPKKISPELPFEIIGRVLM